MKLPGIAEVGPLRWMLATPFCPELELVERDALADEIVDVGDVVVMLVAGITGAFAGAASSKFIAPLGTDVQVDPASVS